MYKKIIIYAFILSCFSVGAVFFFATREHYVQLEPQVTGFKNSLSPQKELPRLLIKSSWSTAPNEASAVGEVSRQIKNEIDSPSFIFLFFTSPYRGNKLCAELNTQFPHSQIMGIQSSRGVFSNQGFHSSPNGSLAVLAFKGDDFSVGVGGGELNEQQDHLALALRSIKMAEENSGNRQGPPTAIVTGQYIGYSEKYCLQLNTYFPRDINMIGGNQINNDVQAGEVIVNNKSYPKGFVIALIYTSNKTGDYFHGGFLGQRKTGIITAVQKDNPYIIKTIDNQPAFQVYNCWTGGFFDSYKSITRDAVVDESVYKPLAKILLMENGKKKYLTMHPWKFFPDGSINCGVAVKEGDRVYYAEGSRKILEDRGGFVARNALINGNIKIDDIAGGICINCVGAGAALGLDNKVAMEQLVENIRNDFKNKPFIGAFLGGEQGSVKGHGYFAANLMCSMLVFSQKEKWNAESEK